MEFIRNKSSGSVRTATGRPWTDDGNRFFGNFLAAMTGEKVVTPKITAVAMRIK